MAISVFHPNENKVVALLGCYVALMVICYRVSEQPLGLTFFFE